MRRIEEIETPAVIIDLDILDNHLQQTSMRAAEAKVRLRPHIKTHKSQWIALEQIKHGACGVTVAKLGEAEVMAEAGIKDILIAYPLIGVSKLKRLSKLMEKCEVSVSVDSMKAAEGLSELGESIQKKIKLYVDVDTGLNRCGKSPGEETVELVKKMVKLPGIQVIGLMTHAGNAYGQENLDGVRRVAQHEAESLVTTKEMLSGYGIDVPEISVGSTPTSHFITEQSGVTEMRPGAYVFGDRSQTALGLINNDQCAMTILATVVSKPRPGVAIIDAGSKTFSSDLNSKFPGYGEWVENPAVYIERLSEEHGNLHVPDGVELQVGQTLSFIPNHCCTVTNLQDELVGVRKGVLEKVIKVDARGKTK